MCQTIYKIPAPHAINHWVVVYGDPDNAVYEWRILDANHETIIDTYNRQYGQAEIALRDALVYATID